MKELIKNSARFLKPLHSRFSLKVFVCFFALTIVIVGALNLVFFSWQRMAVRDELTDKGRLLAGILAHNVTLGVFSEDQKQLGTPMQAIIRDRDVEEVSVLTLNGKVLKRMGQPAGAGPAGDLRGGETLLVPQQKGIVEPFLESDDNLEFWEPVRLESTSFSEEGLFFEEVGPVAAPETIGFVRVVLNKQRLTAGFHEIVLRSGLVGLAFLLFGLLATLVISRELTKPLGRLLERIKMRDLPKKVGDELAQLEDTYVDLDAKLAGAFDTINKLNRELEEKVEVRTEELHAANKKLLQRSEHLIETNRQLEETLAQLKEAQVQLVQSEKLAALGQLVAGLAHEINNTINFVSGALPPLRRVLGEVGQVLEQYGALASLEPAELPARLAEIESFKAKIGFAKRMKDLEVLLENIREGAGRTSQIVKDLKNFARSDTTSRKQVDIHDSLESTLTLLQSECKNRIEILREYEPDLPLVFCVPGLVNQVLMNILLNAIQAIEGPGTIRIRTWAEEEELHIRIADSGSGMSAGVLSKIFDPFFTTKEVGKGTGLGLSVSYGIISKHQGEIKATSEGPGQGSRFEIILPLAQCRELEESSPLAVH